MLQNLGGVLQAEVTRVKHPTSDLTLDFVQGGLLIGLPHQAHALEIDCCVCLPTWVPGRRCTIIFDFSGA